VGQQAVRPAIAAAAWILSIASSIAADISTDGFARVFNENAKAKSIAARFAFRSCEDGTKYVCSYEMADGTRAIARAMQRAQNTINDLTIISPGGAEAAANLPAVMFLSFGLFSPDADADERTVAFKALVNGLGKDGKGEGNAMLYGVRYSCRRSPRWVFGSSWTDRRNRRGEAGDTSQFRGPAPSVPRRTIRPSSQLMPTMFPCASNRRRPPAVAI
jgi:hypothetical protein